MPSIPDTTSHSANETAKAKISGSKVKIEKPMKFGATKTYPSHDWCPRLGRDFRFFGGTSCGWAGIAVPCEAIRQSPCPGMSHP